jgi:transcriptional regulator with XRE-family HTH domain
MSTRVGVAPTLTTGLRSLDELIGGLRLGDNVVWEVDGPDEAPFVNAFARASRGVPLAYVSFDVSPQAVLDRLGDDWDVDNFLLVDCFTDGLGGGGPVAASFYEGKGRGKARVERMDSPGTPAAVQDFLAEIELEQGRGARYVFDSLTGIQGLWGTEEALSLFLKSCPRLYDLRTAAYWILQRPAHDAAFLSRLRHVTQVVVELVEDNGKTTVRVGKAQGRSSGVAGRRGRFSFQNGRFRLITEPTGVRERVGDILRAQRIARGLSQAELARRIGISPSGLSQAERGTSGLSSETLARAWEAMGVAPDPAVEPSPPYRVNRRGSREFRTIARGMVAEELVDTPGHRLLLVRVDGKASGRGTPVATKREEVVAVLEGVFEVRVGEGRETLHAGDALLLTEEPVGSWRNPGPDEALLLWGVLL